MPAISREARNVLLELMNESVKFRCGIFTRHKLRQLARRSRSTRQKQRNDLRQKMD